MTQPIPEHDDMTADCTFVRDNLDAYVLGALSDTEASQITRHLDSCDDCRQQYMEALHVTMLLPLLAEQVDPPASSKSRLLDRIASTPATPHPKPAMIGNPWDTASAPAPAEPVPGKQGNIPWQRWIAPALVAPLAICLIILSAWTHSLQNEVEHLRSQGTSGVISTETSNTLAYDMQLYQFTPACEDCEEQQASGQLGANPNGNVGVVVAWNLDPNEKHQVWCIDSQGEKTMVSNLEVEYTGNVFQTVNFPQPLGGYQQIYVARHDGSDDPDAELMVAVNHQHEVATPPTQEDTTSNGG